MLYEILKKWLQHFLRLEFHQNQFQNQKKIQLKIFFDYFSWWISIKSKISNLKRSIFSISRCQNSINIRIAFLWIPASIFYLKTVFHNLSLPEISRHKIKNFSLNFQSNHSLPRTHLNRSVTALLIQSLPNNPKQADNALVCCVSSRHSTTFLFVYEVEKRKFPNSVISKMCGRNNRRKWGYDWSCRRNTKHILWTQWYVNEEIASHISSSLKYSQWVEEERRNNKLFLFHLARPPASQQKCHFFIERLVDSRRDVESVLERGGIEFPASTPTLPVTGEAKTKLNFFIFPRLKRHVREQSFCRERKTESMWNNLCLCSVRCALVARRICWKIFDSIFCLSNLLSVGCLARRSWQ